MKSIVHEHDSKVNIGAVSFWFVVIFTLISSIIGISSLCLGIFYPMQTVVVGLLVATLLLPNLCSYTTISESDTVNWRWLVLILLVAFIFRSEPYYWIFGSQDQGIYASMSAYFQQNGQVFITDHFSFDNEILNNIYLNSLRADTYQPGVYYGGDADYVFQFYHLHPLWMAIFGELFGDTARFYSLTFFSLLSISGLFLLTYELTRSSQAAVATGLLIAFNPLHAFFSKWPVTEVVALAFTSVGLYLLLYTIRWSKIKGEQWWKFPIIIAASFFSLFFFTRISGFIYLPFLAGLILLAVYQRNTGREKTGKIVSWFAGITLISYIISIFYGLYYSYPYTIDIYSATAERLLGNDQAINLLIIPAALILLTSGIIVLIKSGIPRLQKREQQWVNLISILMSLALLFFIAWGIWRYIHTYFISIGQEFSLDYIRSNILASGVVSWFLYSSPILIILTVISLFKNKRTPLVVACLSFLLAPLLYIFVLNWKVGYHFYYSRYMLSEAVPYSIVFGVYLLYSYSSKPILRNIVVGTSILFFGYFTIQQIGLREGEKNYEVLSEISTQLDQDDILLFNYEGWQTHPTKIFTPLRFYFGEKLFGFNLPDLVTIVDNLRNLRGEVYILSPKEIQSEVLAGQVPKNFVTYDKILERGLVIPTKKIENFSFEKLFLYKIDDSKVNLSKEQEIVTSLYQKYLRRTPNTNNIIGMVEQLKKGTLTSKQIEVILATSQEYVKRFLLTDDPVIMIQGLYNDIYQTEIPDSASITRYYKELERLGDPGIVIEKMIFDREDSDKE